MSPEPSTPNHDKGDFGEISWHHRDHIIMFRDIGDGRCRIYISKIKPLFERITIGRGGVAWEDVEDQCSQQIELMSEAVLETIG